MSKLSRILVVAGIAGLFAGGVLLYQSRARRGVGEPAREYATNPRELIFSRSLMITADSLGIDDAELSVIPCGDEPQSVGYLEITPDLKAELTCSTDYLGGVNLTFTGAAGDEETISVAQQDGDAGDMWDTRSLITRSTDGRLIIEMISLSSSESISTDDDQPASCSVRQESLIWEAQAKVFSRAEGPGEFFISRFTPPINVVNDCLDSKGNWRGSSR